MKITGYRVEPYTFSRGRKIGDANNPSGLTAMRGALLFLETDVGITGICPGGANDALFRVIEGQDPRGVVGLWKR